MTNFQFQERYLNCKLHLDCFSILITISDMTVKKTIVLFVLFSFVLLLYIFVFVSVLFLLFSYSASYTKRKGSLGWCNHSKTLGLPAKTSYTNRNKAQQKLEVEVDLDIPN